MCAGLYSAVSGRMRLRKARKPLNLRERQSHLSATWRGLHLFHRPKTEPSHWSRSEGEIRVLPETLPETVVWTNEERADYIDLIHWTGRAVSHRLYCYQVVRPPKPAQGEFPEPFNSFWPSLSPSSAPPACLTGRQWSRMRTCPRRCSRWRSKIMKVKVNSEEFISWFQDAVDCATQALEKYNIEKDIAAYIKKEFDKKYVKPILDKMTSWSWSLPGTTPLGTALSAATLAPMSPMRPGWLRSLSMTTILALAFCVVLMYQIFRHFIYFYLGQVAILLFKSG